MLPSAIRRSGPEFEQHAFPREYGVAEAARIVSSCVSAEGPTVLYVRRKRVVGDGLRVSSGGTPRLLDVGDGAPGTAVQAVGPSRFGTSAGGGPAWSLRPVPLLAAPTIEEVDRAARYIREYRFSPCQQKWIDGYCAVGKRNVYLWRWTGCAIDWLTLSCVSPEWRANVCDTKFLAAMFNVLVDDVVDERRDPSAMVDVLSLMGDDPPPAAERLGRYGEFIREVWAEIRGRVEQYPREAEFRRLLSYDFRQLCNQVDYSGLLHRHPHLINQTEHDLYSPHGMMVACAATLDLTCSPGFRSEDLGTLREAVWHANSMARIGNLVTTWQREIGHNDFSSGVFARAVSLGWLHVDDLSSSNRTAIEAAITQAGIEQEFAESWRRHRQQLIELTSRASSVSILALIDGLGLLLGSEYASRGYK
jgi:hypothetical protein